MGALGVLTLSTADWIWPKIPNKNPLLKLLLRSPQTFSKDQRIKSHLYSVVVYICLTHDRSLV